VEHLLDPGALAAARVPAAGCRRTIAHGACRERGGVIACRLYALDDARPKRLFVHVRSRYLVRMCVYIYEEVDVSLVGSGGRWP
jgi:hypothetical protein